MNETSTEKQHIFVCLDGSSRSSGADKLAKERHITNTDFLPGGKRLILQTKNKEYLREMFAGKKAWLITDKEMDEEKETKEVKTILDELEIDNEIITFVGILTKIEGALTGEL